MVRKNSIPMRVDPELKKFLRDIKIERIKSGNTKKIISDRELTLELTRIPNLKSKLIRRKL